MWNTRVIDKSRNDRPLSQEPFYWVLRHLVYELHQRIERKPICKVFDQLREVALKLGMKDFDERYPSAASIAMYISYLRPQLEREFSVEIKRRKTAPSLYTFGPLEESLKVNKECEANEKSKEISRDEGEYGEQFVDRIARLRERAKQGREIKAVDKGNNLV